MSKFTLLLTKPEAQQISKYVSKQFGKNNSFNFNSSGLVRKEFDDGAFADFYRCTVELDGLPEGVLYTKSGLVHKNLSEPKNRDVFQSTSKHLVVDKHQAAHSFSSRQLPDDTRLFLNKLSEVTRDRDAALKRDAMVSLTKFVVNCDALLNRFFYINKSVDSLNSTSDAVFNYCLNGVSKGHKHEHWVNYLNENPIRRSPSIVLESIAKIIEKNPTYHNDELEVINGGVVTREQASKIAGLVESSLMSSSISLGSGFSAQLLNVEPKEPVLIRGVIFGIGQSAIAGKVQYEMRIKTEKNQLVKIVSGSEYFGGLVSKQDLILCANQEVPVEVKGEVLGTNMGLKIGANYRIPPSTTIKASNITQVGEIVRDNTPLKKLQLA